MTKDMYTCVSVTGNFLRVHTSDVNKDIKLKAKDLSAKAKAKDCMEFQGQSQGLEMSTSNYSPVFLHHF